MKKFLVLTIMMFTLVANTFASSVNINVNGKNIPNGGIIVDGKTYVSVRNVFESLGDPRAGAGIAPAAVL